MNNTFKHAVINKLFGILRFAILPFINLYKKWIQSARRVVHAVALQIPHVKGNKFGGTNMVHLSMLRLGTPLITGVMRQEGLS